MFKFEWEGNKIKKVNGKALDNLIISEDAAIIWGKEEILSIVDNYLEELEVKDFSLTELIKRNIEQEVIACIPDWEQTRLMRG